MGVDHPILDARSAEVMALAGEMIMKQPGVGEFARKIASKLRDVRRVDLDIRKHYYNKSYLCHAYLDTGSAKGERCF